MRTRRDALCMRKGDRSETTCPGMLCSLDFEELARRRIQSTGESVSGTRDLRDHHTQTCVSIELSALHGVPPSAMAELPTLDHPPADVETDDCLPSYNYLYSPSLLSGRVAFITGGGSGIGFRIAEIFMRHGCDTVIVSRNLQRVSQAAEKLQAATGRRCLPLQGDVRQPESLIAAVDETLSTFSRVDILVNNAAGNFLCPASALSFNAFKTVIDIDTGGTFNASKIVFEKFFQHHGGVIVNITATLSYRGQVLQMHAGSAKAAIDAMTKHLAVEWGPSRVRVNSLAPGPISGTEGMRRLAGPKVASAMSSTIPLQRMGNKTEIAHGALFLASPLASYMTGTTLLMDGGSWLTSPNQLAASMGTLPSPRL